jgi:hypothetical protein
MRVAAFREGDSAGGNVIAPGSTGAGVPKIISILYAAVPIPGSRTLNRRQPKYSCGLLRERGYHPRWRADRGRQRLSEVRDSVRFTGVKQSNRDRRCASTALLGDSRQFLICPDRRVLKLPSLLPRWWRPFPLELPCEPSGKRSSDYGQGAFGELGILLGGFRESKVVQLRIDLD